MLVYDPETDTWTRKADMLTPRGYHSSSVANGKIYVFGGSVTACCPWTPTATVEEFDPDGSSTSVQALGWGLIKILMLR